MNRPRLLVLVALAIFGCEDANGELCPGRRYLCAWHFESDASCGEWRETAVPAGTTGFGSPTAFTDENGACVLWLDAVPAPGWRAAEDWCGEGLLEEPGPCPDQWLAPDDN